MTIIKNTLLVILLVASAGFLPFHHGWSSYDQNKVIDYTGKVEEFTFENPHAMAKVKVKAKTWTVFLAPTSRMTDRGVPVDKLKKGSSLRIVGYPHKEIKDEMRAERIYVDNQKYELR